MSVGLRLRVCVPLPSRNLSSDRKTSRSSIEGCLCVGEGLQVRVLRVRRLELVDIAVDEGGRLVLVAAAADQVHQSVRVVLALAEGLRRPSCVDEKIVKGSRAR